MTRIFAAVVLVVVGCGGSSSNKTKTDAGNQDGPVDSAVDAPVTPIDAPFDAPPVVGSCQSIAPFCADGFCLSIPDAPKRGKPFARAFGANGALYFGMGQTNTIARISSTGLEPVDLPSVDQPGFRVGTVSAMTALSPTDIYACTPLTIVWHYDGVAWSQLPAGWLQGECDVLWAGAADDFWSIGAGYLRRRLNGTWTEYGGTRQVFALDGRNANDVWFGGVRGYVAHWNGTQYEVLIDASDDSDVRDIRNVAILGANDVALGDKRVINGTLMTSTQLGYPAPPELTWGSSNDFWIVTRSNGVTPRALWRYNGTWTQHAVPAGISLAGLAITGTAPNNVWFLSDHGTLHWNGTALESCAIWQPTQPTGRIVGVGANYDELWLHDQAGGLWRSTGGGNFLDVHDEPAGVRGFDAHASGVFAVSGTDNGNPSNGTMPVVHRYNGGTSWTSITCPWTPGEEALLHAAKVVAANDVWFAGDGGRVYHWNGTACTDVPHPLAITAFRHINATGPNDVWIFGDTATLHWDGTSLLRHPQTITVVDSDAAGTSLWAVATNDVLQWNGTTWTSKGAGSITNGRRIYASSATDVWVENTGTVLQFDGAQWTPRPLPYKVAAGIGVGAGMWGTGSAGDFVISTAGGIVRHQ